MRRMAKKCISVILSAALILTSGAMSLPVMADSVEAVEEVVVEATEEVVVEAVETTEEGTLETAQVTIPELVQAEDEDGKTVSASFVGQYKGDLKEEYTAASEYYGWGNQRSLVAEFDIAELIKGECISSATLNLTAVSKPDIKSNYTKLNYGIYYYDGVLTNRKNEAEIRDKIANLPKIDWMDSAEVATTTSLTWSCPIDVSDMITDGDCLGTHPDGKFSIYFNAPYGGTAKNAALTDISVTLYTTSEEEYVKLALQSVIEEYNDNTITTSFLPISKTKGVDIDYIVTDDKSKKYIAIDGENLLVTRPAAQEGNQTVNLTVVASYKDIELRDSITMTVRALPPVSPYAKSTMNNMIAFCEETLKDHKESNMIANEDGTGTGGQKSYSLAQDLEAAIADAKACTDTSQMSMKTTMLILTGYDFMGSGIIDNSILYESKNPYLDDGNTLVYSEYRAKLEAMLWKAKAALLLDPELYPTNAKETLQVEIDRAELALARDKQGRSKLSVPFKRTMMYYKNPDDSMIQYVTHYTANLYGYNTTNQYGFDVVLDWYFTENILYDAYVTKEIPATFAGYINGGSGNTGKWTSGTIQYGKTGKELIGMLQFDMSNVQAVMQPAQIRMYSTSNNTFTAYCYSEADEYVNGQPTWDQLVARNGAYVDYRNGVISGNLIGTYKSAKKNLPAYLAVPDKHIMEAAMDGALTVSMQVDADKKYRGSAYGVDKSNSEYVEEYMPTLIVKTADVDITALKESARELISYQEDIIENATTYPQGNPRNAKVGSFDEEKYALAKQAMDEVESNLNGYDAYKIATSLSNFMSKAYECRMSIALASDVYVDEKGRTDANNYFSNEEAIALRKQVKENISFKDFYDEVKSSYKKLDLNATKDYYQRWTESDKTLWDANTAFATPPASGGGKHTQGRHIRNENGDELPATMPSGHTYTGKAYITLTLESEDNDTTGYSGNIDGTGCGEVWFDNMTIASDAGNTDIEIPNANFETKAVNGDEPLYWTLSTTGNGEGRWETARQNVASGKRSLYFHNPDGNSSVTWTSAVFDLPIITDSDGFDITYSVKQFGVFEKAGVQIRFHFLTETANGQEEIVSRPLYYNAKAKPSSTGVGSFLVALQQTYIVALLDSSETERIHAAKLAKEYLKLVMQQMNEGVEHWKRVGSRPDGIDSYGGVQAGRWSFMAGIAYSIIRDMVDENGDPIVTDEEKEELAASAAFMMRDLNDMRDHYRLSYEEGLGGGNWSSDQNSGASMMALGFEEDLKDLNVARAHLYTAIRNNEGQLVCNVLEDGAWPESVRYHFAALNKVYAMAKSLRFAAGIDWWADKNIELYKTFEYIVQIQTPAYVSGNVSTPWFGDHTVSDGSDLYLLGMYYDEMLETKPELALQMYATWKAAGSPPAASGGQDCYLVAFFGGDIDLDKYGDYDKVYDLKSTDYARYEGTFVMRNNFRVYGSESYVASHIQEVDGGHAHADDLSFIMYADNIPLVIDPGSPEGYWSGTGDVLKPSYLHPLVSYANGENSYESRPVVSTQKGFYASDSMDIVRGSVSNQSKTGEQTRDLAFVKNGFEAVVIYDQVTGAGSYGTRMNLPLLTRVDDGISKDGNKFTAKMFGGIELEITYLQGNHDNYGIDKYFANGTFQKRPDEAKVRLDHLYIRNEGNDNYLTVLFPKTSKRGSLTTQDLGNDVYKLTHSTGNSVYVVTNENTIAKTVTLPERNIIDLEETSRVYESGTVSIPANTMKIFTSDVTTTQEEEKSGTEISTEKPVGTQSTNTSGTATSGAGAMGGGTSTGGAAGGTTDTPQTGQDDSDDVFKDFDTAASISRNLVTGQKAKVECDVTDDVTVTFQSSNDKVATISAKGLIKAKKSGTSDISVLVTKEGVTQKVTIRIKVKDKKNVPSGVRKLGVVKTTKAGTPVIEMTKALKKSRTSSLDVEKKEGVVLSYSTSDKSVATVTDSGKIKGTGKGTADVIAKVKYNGVVSKYLVEVTVK